jgi:hypothetical protein
VTGRFEACRNLDVPRLGRNRLIEQNWTLVLSQLCGHYKPPRNTRNNKTARGVSTSALLGKPGLLNASFKLASKALNMVGSGATATTQDWDMKLLVHGPHQLSKCSWLFGIQFVQAI